MTREELAINKYLKNLQALRNNNWDRPRQVLLQKYEGELVATIFIYNQIERLINNPQVNLDEPAPLANFIVNTPQMEDHTRIINAAQQNFIALDDMNFVPRNHPVVMSEENIKILVSQAASLMNAIFTEVYEEATQAELDRVYLPQGWESEGPGEIINQALRNEIATAVAIPNEPITVRLFRYEDDTVYNATAEVYHTATRVLLINLNPG